MRPKAIVATPPLLNDDLGVEPCPKPLQAQTFVPELAAEALIRAVLPGLAGIAQRHLDAMPSCPFQNGA